MANRWLSRLGAEQPEPTTGCSEADCDIDDMAPVDVYCRTHERFLPGAGGQPRRLRWLLANVVRVAVCGAFVLTAYANSPAPAVLVGVAAGAAVVALPLRRYPVALAFVTVAWTTMCVLAALWWATGRPAAGWILWAALVGVLWLTYLGVAAAFGSDTLGAVAVPATVAMALAVTVAAGWVARLWGPGMHPVLIRPLMTLMVTSMVGTLLAAIIVGLTSGGPIDTTVGATVTRPSRPTPVRWRLAAWQEPPVRPAGPADRLARATRRFLYRLLETLVILANWAVTLLRLFLYASALVTVLLLNWLIRLLVLTARRIRRTLVIAAWVAAEAARIAGRTMLRSVRVVLLPLGLISAAAVLVPIWAEQVRLYLVDGSLVALGWLGVAVLAGLTALTVTWILLCGLPWRRYLRSVSHSASITAAHGLLLLAVGGWVVGLPGTLGHGPIQVGWLTITATGLLLGATLWSSLTRRAAAEGTLDRR